MILTQSPCSGDVTEGASSHFSLRQDTELVVGGRRQACHLQPSARGGGHRHREPVLLPIIITCWNLFHPAEEARQREKEWEQKRSREFWECDFMKHDRKVGFIKHSYSSSAPECVAETALMYPVKLHRELATPIIVIFMFLPELRFYTSFLYRENYLTLRLKNTLFTYSKTAEEILIPVSEKQVFCFFKMMTWTPSVLLVTLTWLSWLSLLIFKCTKNSVQRPYFTVFCNKQITFIRKITRAETCFIFKRNKKLPKEL